MSLLTIVLMLNLSPTFNGDIIIRSLFFYKEFPEGATADEIFHVTAEYLHENGLQCKDCISVCTDGCHQ
jgi:hypothetical protein